MSLGSTYRQMVLLFTSGAMKCGVHPLSSAIPNVGTSLICTALPKSANLTVRPLWKTRTFRAGKMEGRREGGRMELTDSLPHTTCIHTSEAPTFLGKQTFPLGKVQATKLYNGWYEAKHPLVLTAESGYGKGTRIIGYVTRSSGASFPTAWSYWEPTQEAVGIHSRLGSVRESGKS